MKFKLLIFFLLIIVFRSFAQDEVHFCAQKHQNGHSKTYATKYLSIAEESEANKYDVSYYELDLNMTNLNASVSGTAKVNGKTLLNLDSIVLELDMTLAISEIRLNGIASPFSRNATVLKVPINASAGMSFWLEVDYTGTPPAPSSNPGGVSGVASSYVAAMNDRITFTISTPFYAHQWFPCKQVLSDKADSSKVVLTVPSTCKAGSNGILESVVDLGNGITRYSWKNSHSIGYNLIFATVAPFIEYIDYAYPSQLLGDSVLIQSYIYGSGANLTAITDQCDLIPSFVEMYSDIYGIYPFYNEKYGINAAPFGGGMEHQTMPTIGSFEKKVTAHELCHQWWGDNVGFRSFSDIWLSEGFATYSEFLLLENLYPSESDALLASWHNGVKTAVGGSVFHVDTFNLYRIYDTRLTYKKGASIIHTLREIIDNDNLFFQSLRTYLNDFADSVGSAPEFKASIESTTGMNLSPFFNEWYYGEGFPKYSTRWNCIGNDLLLEISHTASKPTVTTTFTNPIEILFTRSSGGDTTIRFDINSNLDQFYVANIGSVTGIGEIDPFNWVINNTGTNVNDPSFVADIVTLEKSNELKIHPNPTTDGIMLEMEIIGSYNAELADLNGIVLEQKNFESNTHFNLENLAQGIYLLRITNQKNNSIFLRRIVKI